MNLNFRNPFHNLFELNELAFSTQTPEVSHGEWLIDGYPSSSKTLWLSGHSLTRFLSPLVGTFLKEHLAGWIHRLLWLRLPWREVIGNLLSHLCIQLLVSHFVC